MHKLLPLLGLTCLLFACRNYSLDHVDTAIEVETPVYEEAEPLPEPEPEPVEEPAPEPEPIDCLESSTGLDIEQVVDHIPRRGAQAECRNGDPRRAVLRQIAEQARRQSG